MAESQPIIILRKKVAGHAGHHGGAWKVAYADFVTALMALFIVLWLMGANDDVKHAVARAPLHTSGQRSTERIKRRAVCLRAGTAVFPARKARSRPS